MLTLSFLWHMHQPWYADPAAQRFLLPWVRLHGTKDYLDMAQLLSEYPKIRVVLNATPCLLEQLELYVQGIQDEHQILSLKAAEDLSPTEAARLVGIGFLGEPRRMIRPYPRYQELFLKAKRKERFSPQDLRDLAVWSNCAWMDPRWRREDPFVKGLFAKGSGFTEEEKALLLRSQMALLERIIPTYRALQEKGQVELTTSPWAHPILPLLARFGLSDDAAWHLKEAVVQHERRFGSPPQGLWPSEGAVSMEILPLIAASGLQWLATDEQILWKSLERKVSRNLLYRPYRIHTGEKEKTLTVLFRDHVLSDRIGFVYSGLDPEEAAHDFVKRLLEIEKASASQGEAAPFVLVALDGENPWEYYPEDGEPFLRALYGELQETPNICCTTVRDYLKVDPPHEELKTLASGSWIRGDFSTWVGHPPQDRAWQELRQARRWKGPQESKSIAIAQGSDWFWWLGPEHSSSQDPIFDALFRMHLKEVYRQAGEIPPPTLDQMLKIGFEHSLVIVPTGFIAPVVDGEISSYFEWLRAGEVIMERSAAMARSQPLFERFFWGCDAKNLFFRLDPGLPLSGKDLTLTLKENRFEAVLEFQQGLLQGKRFRVQSGGVQGPWQELQCAFSKVVEISLPLAALGLALGNALHLTIAIDEEGLALEHYPMDGRFALALPVEPGEEHLWSA